MLIFLAMALGLATPQAAKPGDDVVYIENDNAAMAAAAAKARAQLPAFLDRLARRDPSESDFAVKFDLDPGEKAEYIWGDIVARDGDTLDVALANIPLLKGYKIGQRVKLKLADVIDWSYVRAGKLHGHYTTRVLLGRMPDREAAELRAILADPE